MENITDMEKFDERSTPQVPAVMGGVSLVQMAIQKNYDPAFIEKMMDLQERNDTKVAKQAYIGAMAEFKANLPTVIKDKENKQYSSMYVSESALLNTINPELSKHGLSATFSFPETEGNTMKVTCTITHKAGYGESVTLPGPIDTSGSKNPLQQVKSTVTYLRKATFEAITGIATSDPIADDDGNSSGSVEYISIDQQTEINDYFDELYTDNGKKFLKWLGAESVDTIPIKDYKKAIDSLKDIKAERKKPKREPGDED